MKKLIEILREFEKNRTNAVDDDKWRDKSIEEKYEAIAEWFRPCAEKILCEGYFLINGKYIIDLAAIELYYHEEDGDIKDYIMYHTNEQMPKKYMKTISKFKKQNAIDKLPIFYQRIENNEYPYFTTGSFNLHQSGIDITFENDDNKTDRYRASFLIRSYRMFHKKDLGKDILYDPCPSHLYDDLYYSGLLSVDKSTIEWIDGNKGVIKVKKRPRINVAEYRKDEKGKYVKTDVKITDSEYQSEIEDANNNHRYSIYFKSGSKIYKQDMREWHYCIEGAEEIK